MSDKNVTVLWMRRHGSLSTVLTCYIPVTLKLTDQYSLVLVVGVCLRYGFLLRLFAGHS